MLKTETSQYLHVLKVSEHIRTFTTTASVFDYSTNSSVVPVKIYRNADLDKLRIIKENKGKGGVYRWINNLNGKSYIGSSSNLGRRFTQYFSISNLEIEIKKGRSIICSALLKYKYSAFSLEIIEYCAPEKATIREQYFMYLICPEYNILSKAGSSLGHRHSEETKAKMSIAWTSLEERKTKISALKKGVKISEEIKAKISMAKKGNVKPEGSGRPSVNIEVVDTITQEKIVFPSISEAARVIGYTKEGISLAFKRQKEKGVDFIFVKKKRYKIKKID